MSCLYLWKQALICFVKKIPNNSTSNWKKTYMESVFIRSKCPVMSTKQSSKSKRYNADILWDIR